MDRLAAISLLHRGRQLAAEIACADPAQQAFVGVYPLDLSRPGTREFLYSKGFSIFPEVGRAYHIRTFEVDRKLLKPTYGLAKQNCPTQTVISPSMMRVC